MTRRTESAFALVCLLAWGLGCCEVTETQEVRQEFGGAWGTRDCRSVCLAPPNCEPNKRLLSCRFDATVSPRNVTCVFERSDCPEVPYPRASCRLHRTFGATMNVFASRVATGQPW